MINVTRQGGTVDREYDEIISINENNSNTVSPIPKDSNLAGSSKITMKNGDIIIVKETLALVNRKIDE